MAWGDWQVGPSSIAVMAAAVAGCGGGEAPPLADCFVGDVFAECGGDEEARFGCRPDDGECKWFAGGVVAVEFQASPCPADDLCCLDEWPYPPAEISAGPLVKTLYALGTLPWDRTREMSLTLAEDSTLVSSVQVGCTGTGEDFTGTPCDQAFSWPAMEDTLTVMLRASYPNLGPGWELWIEADVIDRRARACKYFYTDYNILRCSGGRGAVCAVSGDLTLQASPAAYSDVQQLAGRFDFDFASGLHVTGTF